MIKTIKIETSNFETPISCMVKAVIINDQYLAIHCQYSRQLSKYRYVVSHIPTGRQIWQCCDKTIFQSFVRELVTLNLDWDFRNPDLIPLKMRKIVWELIRKFNKTIQEKESQDEESYEKFVSRWIRIEQTLEWKRKNVQRYR